MALVFHGDCAVRRVPNFSGICEAVELSILYVLITVPVLVYWL